MTLNAVTDESGDGFADRLLALVMLNALDEKRDVVSRTPCAE